MVEVRRSYVFLVVCFFVVTRESYARLAYALGRLNGFEESVMVLRSAVEAELLMWPCLKAEGKA